MNYMMHLSANPISCHWLQTLLLNLDGMRSSLKKCFTSSSNLSVAFDCRDAIELIVAAIAGFVALEYHANVPTTS